MKNEIPTEVSFLGDLLPEVVGEMRSNLYKSLGEMGVLTGISELDKLIGGFRAPGLYIIGALSNMGKSALMTQFSLSAIKQDKKVLFFTLEMTNKEVVERVVVNEGEMPSYYFNDGAGATTQAEKAFAEEKLTDTEAVLNAHPKSLMLVDKRVTIDELVSISKKCSDVDLIVVDYAQIVECTKSHHGRHLEVGQITKDLKELAKEMDVPVVAGAQVNRIPVKPNKSEQRKPGLSDLRESASLEHDADTVLILHRERDEEGQLPKVGDATLTQVKARKRAHGEVTLTYIGEQFKFVPKPAETPSFQGSTTQSVIQANGPDGSLLDTPPPPKPYVPF